MSESKHTITILADKGKPVHIIQRSCGNQTRKSGEKRKIGHGGRSATLQQSSNREESGGNEKNSNSIIIIEKR